MTCESQTNLEEQAEKLRGLLPSTSSVVRALSPILTPAFMAANSMAQKAKLKSPNSSGTESNEHEKNWTTQQEITELPGMTQVNYFSFESYIVVLGVFSAFRSIK